MRIITFDSDAYHNGKKHGRQLKESIQYRLKSNYISAKAVEQFLPHLESLHTYCKTHYPSAIEELQGIAEGAHIPYFEILLLNSPELQVSREGCSSIALTNPTGALLVHNEDGVASERKKDCALGIYTTDTTKFHSFIYAGELAGSAYTWNSHGLFYTVNYVKPTRATHGVPRFFQSHALTKAYNLTHACELLEQIPCMTGYHYFIGKGNEIISVETNGNTIEKIPVTDIMCHTNHYLSKTFATTTPKTANSLIRLKRMNELLLRNVKPHAILCDSATAPHGIYATTGEYRTLSTVAFDTEARKAIIFDKKSIIRSFRLAHDTSKD